MSLLARIKQRFCKHNFAPPQIIRETEEYKPSFVTHPTDGTQIPVLKREFICRSICVKCGHKKETIGYDTIDVENQEEKDAKDRIIYLKSLPRSELVRMFISPHLHKAHPNPKSYLDWLETQPDELVFNMVLRLEVRK
jgi:hypothetical protein